MYLAFLMLAGRFYKKSILGWIIDYPLPRNLLGLSTR